MPELYYILTNGTQSGPFTLGQLRSMWSEGQIAANSHYWTEGEPDWQPTFVLSPGLKQPPVEQMISQDFTEAVAPPDESSAPVQQAQRKVFGPTSAPVQQAQRRVPGLASAPVQQAQRRVPSLASAPVQQAQRKVNGLASLTFLLGILSLVGIGFLAIPVETYGRLLIFAIADIPELLESCPGIRAHLWLTRNIFVLTTFIVAAIACGHFSLSRGQKIGFGMTITGMVLAYAGLSIVLLIFLNPPGLPNVSEPEILASVKTRIFKKLEANPTIELLGSVTVSESVEVSYDKVRQRRIGRAVITDSIGKSATIQYSVEWAGRKNGTYQVEIIKLDHE